MADKKCIWVLNTEFPKPVQGYNMITEGSYLGGLENAPSHEREFNFASWIIMIVGNSSYPMS